MRRLEYAWYRDKLGKDSFICFYQQRRLDFNMMDAAERPFWERCEKMEGTTGKYMKPATIYLVDPMKPLPPSHSNQELADRFNNFFINNVQKIRNNLDILRQDLPEYVETQHDPGIVPFENFNSLSVDELEKLILSCIKNFVNWMQSQQIS